MTSASKLFDTRRLRLGRNSDQFSLGSDLASPPPVDRTTRRHRNGATQTRRNRFDLEGCDRLPRAIHRPGQQLVSRRSQERESSQREEGGRQSSSGNISHSESHSNVIDNIRLNRNDRLPGSVLLARERLLQRLRGIPLSESRESQAAITPLTNSIAPTEKRPPGLTQRALESLPIEVFHTEEDNDEQRLSRLLRECSICLESFLEGDEMICLSCGHRYHFCCLDPWVRTCGDCPYCRRRIDVTLH